MVHETLNLNASLLYIERCSTHFAVVVHAGFALIELISERLLPVLTIYKMVYTIYLYSVTSVCLIIVHCTVVLLIPEWSASGHDCQRLRVCRNDFDGKCLTKERGKNEKTFGRAPVRNPHNDSRCFCACINKPTSPLMQADEIRSCFVGMRVAFILVSLVLVMQLARN